MSKTTIDSNSELTTATSRTKSIQAQLSIFAKSFELCRMEMWNHDLHPDANSGVFGKSYAVPTNEFLLFKRAELDWKDDSTGQNSSSREMLPIPDVSPIMSCGSVMIYCGTHDLSCFDSTFHKLGRLQTKDGKVLPRELLRIIFEYVSILKPPASDVVNSMIVRDPISARDMSTCFIHSKADSYKIARMICHNLLFDSKAKIWVNFQNPMTETWRLITCLTIL